MVTDLSGNFLIQIGSTGEDGLRDGTFDDATFNRPQVSITLSIDTHVLMVPMTVCIMLIWILQGLAYNAKKNLLYVADTENHALR